MTTPFDPTRCGIPPVPDIDSVEGIEDCFISPVPPPIKDCQSPIFPPTDALLNNPPEFNPINIDPPIPVLPPIIPIIPPPPWPQPQIPWLKFPVFKLTECKGKEEIYTIQGIFAFFLKKVVGYRGKCWEVSVEEFNGQQPVLEIPNVSVYPSCDECGSCWLGYRCSDGKTIVVKGNLGEAQRKGKAVRFDFDQANCYVITKKVPCTGSIKNGKILSIYDSCQYCQNVYALVNCNNDSDVIFTHQPLAFYLNVSPRYLIENEIVFVKGNVCYKVADYLFANDSMKFTEVDPYNTLKGCDKCKTKCFELIPCGKGKSIYASSAKMLNTGAIIDLEELKGGVLQLSSNKCYSVGKAVDCSKYNTTGVTVIGTKGSCGECLCYKLKRCADGYKFVSCGGSGDRLTIGKIYISDEYSQQQSCYEVVEYVDPDVASPEQQLTDLEDANVNDCNECLQSIGDDGGGTIVKYKLTPNCFDKNCKDTPKLKSIVTETPLGIAEGGYILYADICWHVSVADANSPTDVKSISFEGPFSYCELCLEETSSPCGECTDPPSPSCEENTGGGGGGGGGSGQYGLMKRCDTGETYVWEYPCTLGDVVEIGNECFECIGSSDGPITLAGTASSPYVDGCCQCLCVVKSNRCVFTCKDQGDGTGVWEQDKSCKHDCNCPASIAGTPCDPGKDKNRSYCCE